MPNRYCRDELILNMLRHVQLPNLAEDEAPNGVVKPESMCIQWLQDIVDYCYEVAPFSTTITRLSLDCTAHADSIILPENFIVDVRNGYTVQFKQNNPRSFGRVFRMPLQKFINRTHFYQDPAPQQQQTYSRPIFYCIASRDPLTNQQLMLLSPIPTNNVTGILWYYALPEPLRANDKPIMPSDQICIEYMRVRALEWAHIIEVGTSIKYCERLVSKMKAEGLLNEPEDDETPFDEQVYRHTSDSFMNAYQWMGPP